MVHQVQASKLSLLKDGRAAVFMYIESQDELNLLTIIILSGYLALPNIREYVSWGQFNHIFRQCFLSIKVLQGHYQRRLYCISI